MFETWLQTSLQRLYDPALGEPIPDELAQLLPPEPETETTH